MSFIMTHPVRRGGLLFAVVMGCSITASLGCGQRAAVQPTASSPAGPRGGQVPSGTPPALVSPDTIGQAPRPGIERARPQPTGSPPDPINTPVSVSPDTIGQTPSANGLPPTDAKEADSGHGQQSPLVAASGRGKGVSGSKGRVHGGRDPSEDEFGSSARCGVGPDDGGRK